MIIFPAIDIKEGKVVRLAQGKFNEVTEYGNDPVAVAKKWEAAGATWLHVVDLDGAQTGTMKNLKLIAEIARTVKVPIQVGGGVRGNDEIVRLISAGVSRVILGTKVLENEGFLKGILGRWKEKIAVSLDCSNGKLTTKGWTEVLDIKATDFAKKLQTYGLRCLIYTDIAKDGMLQGPNYNAIEEMLNTVKIPLIASGGIASLEDIKKLCRLESKGLIGAITGKALYEGTLDLKEALGVC